ncbi:MAG TPA: ribulose bisphosphate carboxylase small subunit, partial [Vampirovibrionales bacterium]
ANSNEQHQFLKPDFRLEHLIEKGEAMVQEQKRIQELRLVAAYNRSLAESNTAQRYGFVPGQPPASGNGIRQENPGFNTQPTAANGSPSVQVSRPQNNPQSATATLDADTVQHIRQLVSQGYPIGIEHVDRRRFSTGSWQSCGCIQTGNESEAIAALNSCLANYAGEYVRLFGVDGNKRRVMETIIQRPNS